MDIKNKAGKYKIKRCIVFEDNLFFVKIIKKCSKKATVRQAPIGVRWLQNKATSDDVDTKPIRSPKDHITSDNAKRM
jgi:hypothetical protein